MARIRTIKPDFFTSDTVSALPLRARLTWIGLWTHCDDYGRCRDNVKLIKAAVWPQDDVSIKDIEADLNTLADRRVILRYEVDGKNYLAVTSWDEHQRVHHPSQSKIPAPLNGSTPPAGPPDDVSLNTPADGRPPDVLGSPPETVGNSPDARGSPPGTFPQEQGTGNREGNREQGGAARGGTRASTRAKRGTRIPDDFTVTTAMVAWASENTPHVDGRYETAQFCDYWRSKAGKDATKLNWVLTWQTWMRKAEQQAPTSRNGARSGTDENIRRMLAGTGTTGPNLIALPGGTP